MFRMKIKVRILLCWCINSSFIAENLGRVATGSFCILKAMNACLFLALYITEIEG
jgi:hypothetical protein